MKSGCLILLLMLRQSDLLLWNFCQVDVEWVTMVKEDGVSIKVTTPSWFLGCLKWTCRPNIDCLQQPQPVTIQFCTRSHPQSSPSRQLWFVNILGYRLRMVEKPREVWKEEVTIRWISELRSSDELPTPSLSLRILDKRTLSDEDDFLTCCGMNLGY